MALTGALQGLLVFLGERLCFFYHNAGELYYTTIRVEPGLRRALQRGGKTSGGVALFRTSAYRWNSSRVYI